VRLAVEYNEERLPAGEAFGVALGLVFVDNIYELAAVKE